MRYGHLPIYIVRQGVNAYLDFWCEAERQCNTGSGSTRVAVHGWLCCANGRGGDVFGLQSEVMWGCAKLKLDKHPHTSDAFAQCGAEQRTQQGQDTSDGPDLSRRLRCGHGRRV